MVHDNQSLGLGLLDIAATGLPVVATVHHPITRDRVLDLAAARWWRKPLVRRWYGFLEMQERVARSIPDLLTVSASSATDITTDFGVRPDQLHVVPLGVDTDDVRAVRSGREFLVASSPLPAQTDRSRASVICCRRWPSSAPNTTWSYSSSPSSNPTARPKN